MTTYILLAALLPIIVLLFYVWRKDKVQPEPTGLLIKAFGLGVLSVFVSLLISMPLSALGFIPDVASSLWDAFSISFFGAAIPEECAKFLMLWLLLRKCRHFDEKMDGVVYAVFVSLGFAALENVLYLFENADEFVTVGIMRALFSVPGHFCFAVLMGYYYSLVKFYPYAAMRHKVLVLLAPIIAHGIYDTILFSIGAIPSLSLLLLPVFLVFCHKLWKYASARIREYVGQ